MREIAGTDWRRAMKTFKTVFDEASLGRVYQHTKDKNIGFITAHREGNSEQENKDRNTELSGGCPCRC
jgi:hypothetical protein